MQNSDSLACRTSELDLKTPDLLNGTFIGFDMIVHHLANLCLAISFFVHSCLPFYCMTAVFMLTGFPSSKWAWKPGGMGVPVFSIKLSPEGKNDVS